MLCPSLVKKINEKSTTKMPVNTKTTIFTRLGQSKGYNFFMAELALFTGVLTATLADTSVAVFTLPFMLPFIGGLVYCVFASVLFGKAAFSQPNQKKYKGEPPYDPNA